MKMTKKTTILFYIALLLMPFSGYANEGGSMIVTESYFNNTKPSLPFIVEVGSGSEIHIDPKWSVKILSVIADNKNVEEKITHRLYGDINHNKIVTLGDFYIYKIRFYELVYGQIDNLDGGYVQYSVPENVKELEVKYTLTLSDGTNLPKVYLLKAKRN